jgi:hypothetical protein
MLADTASAADIGAYQLGVGLGAVHGLTFLRLGHILFAVHRSTSLSRLPKPAIKGHAWQATPIAMRTKAERHSISGKASNF